MRFGVCEARAEGWVLDCGGEGVVCVVGHFSNVWLASDLVGVKGGVWCAKIRVRGRVSQAEIVYGATTKIFCGG